MGTNLIRFHVGLYMSIYMHAKWYELFELISSRGSIKSFKRSVKRVYLLGRKRVYMEEGMSGFYVGAAPRGGGGGGGGGSKCGRWNPTSEQVKVLTELFRSGLRTPTTDQIQKISSQLSFYGKIESKNVFYWFQNHKARERQKRRRVVLVDETTEDNLIPHQHQRKDTNIPSTKRKFPILPTHF